MKKTEFHRSSRNAQNVHARVVAKGNTVLQRGGLLIEARKVGGGGGGSTYKKKNPTLLTRFQNLSHNLTETWHKWFVYQNCQVCLGKIFFCTSKTNLFPNQSSNCYFDH